jgi:hypothetical protein
MTHYNRLQEQDRDPWTQQLEALLLDIASTAQKAGKDWFRSQGYRISKDPDMNDFPSAFLLTNEKQEYFADVYPVRVEKDGTISVTHTSGYQGRPWWKGKSWNEVKQISYKGQAVVVENYPSVLQQKAEHYRWHGGKPAGKHLHDFQRAGIKPEI